VSIELCIVTPEGQSFQGPVDQVVLPGAEGDFGVLKGHERFLAPLRIGPVEIKEGAASRWAAISDGFAEVSGEQVVVLVDECQLADAIDEEQVRSLRAALTGSLSDLTGSLEDERRRIEIGKQLKLVDLKLELAGR
jgi:F-type H+-transporting ATPase subunit epsilon